MSTSTPLHPDQHSRIKIKQEIDFDTIASQQFSALTVQEFSLAASSYPIVLLKDAQTGTFVAAALWGLEGSQNVFYNRKNHQWDAVHLPNEVQCQPFSIGRMSNDSDALILHVNEQSKQVQESDGQALFENGTETAYLKSMQTKLTEHYQNQLLTRDFINLLLEKSLVKEIEMMVSYEDGNLKKVKGLYTIDEEALATLGEDDIHSFFKRNLFVPIYAMLGSLTQFNRLMKLNNQDDQYASIARLQMKTPEID
ncbi:MAG: SapC family protein [Glaciecola sp.]